VFALVGQPNCGKSTLFNALAGFKANTGNFPGTTVAYTESEVVVAGRRVRILDLPGTYSLTPGDEAEQVTRDFLVSGRADVVIAVVDASVLARSIEIVLELVEVGQPLVVALNMMDEAHRKGMDIRVEALSERLGVPVIPVIATRGSGVVRVIEEALRQSERPSLGRPPTYDRDVEEALRAVERRVPVGLASRWRVAPRWIALRLLSGDRDVEEAAAAVDPGFRDFAVERRKALAQMHEWPEETVLASHRHAVALDLFEAVARVVPRRARPIGDRVDAVVMHPAFGLAVAAFALATLFGTAFFIGNAIAGLLEPPFEALNDLLEPLASGSVGWSLLRGLVDGVTGGLGIVLPYLVPLLFVLSLYEDIGYLPRVAFLVDGLMHRIGLHGKSVIPLILGYGCSVPALMGTRILETPRDRILTALLVPLIPCSARTVVILALVGAFLGPAAVFGVYVLNLVVTAVVGRILSGRLRSGLDAGLLMDIPPYRLPPARITAKKVWFRIQEFLVHGWPYLMIGSVILAGLQVLGADGVINSGLAPVTVGVLGLPEAVGVTLFFGILRKELALVMLVQALGTDQVTSAMTPAQILVFTLFVTFYIPCVASLATLVREVGARWTLVSAALGTAIATLVAGVVRSIMTLIA